MNTFDLGRILEEVHWDEYAEFDNPPHYVKSFHHRLKMRRIMNQAVSKQDEQTQRSRIKLSPRKVIILLVLIFTAIITAAAIVVWYGNIYGQRHSDNTELFAVVDGAPEVIEKVYELTEIPEGYELTDFGGGLGYTYVRYLYKKDLDSIIFTQFTHRDFDLHIDNERGEITKTKITGMDAVITSTKYNGSEVNEIFWEYDDYIFDIATNMSVGEAVNLLKSAKITNR